MPESNSVWETMPSGRPSLMHDSARIIATRLRSIGAAPHPLNPLRIPSAPILRQQPIRSCTPPSLVGNSSRHNKNLVDPLLLLFHGRIQRQCSHEGDPTAIG